MATVDFVKSKITNKEDLQYILSYYRFKEKKIVFTNGCFDLLHRGHIEYLLQAAACGDVLIVGLNSDKSVKKLKGADRPLQDEKSRALILASLLFVDHILLFDEETPVDLIRSVQPDVLVKGGDYKEEEIVGNEVVTEKGGKVKIIDYLSGYSTSGLIDKIKKIFTS